jgi:hypothetical protein
MRRSVPRSRRATWPIGRVPVILPFAALALCLAPGPAAPQGWRGPATPPVWLQDRLMIGGWGTTRFGDAAMYRRLAAAGIDLVVPADSFHVATLDSALLAARTVQGLRESDPGFRLRLLSHVIGPRSGPGHLQMNSDVTRNRTAILATLDSLAAYSSVAGFWLWDEPAEPLVMARAADLARLVARHCPGRLPYVNLLPSYIGDPKERGPLADRWRAVYGTDKTKAYPVYLDDWLHRWQDEPYPAPLLSFDHYVFEPSAWVWDDYFLSLKVAREKTVSWSRPPQRIPLWVFVQLSGNRNRKMVPTPAQVRLQVYAALAYGAHGIMYWTLCPSHAGPGYAPALLDPQGEPTDRYDAIAQLDAEVHALGPTLMQLDPVDVGYCAAGGQIGIENDLFTSADRAGAFVSGEVRSDPACMVAHFRGRMDGVDYLLVVNRDLVRMPTFRVRLEAHADTVQLVRRSDGSRVPVGVGLDIIQVRDLPPGTGELYRVVSNSRVSPR